MANGSKTTARAYLWVPEECKKLRGILFLCANVPEMMLAGHPEIRKVCRENDLGIIWCPWANPPLGPQISPATNFRLCRVLP